MKLDPCRGILVGKSKQLDIRVFIFYVPRKRLLIICDEYVFRKDMHKDSVVWDVIKFYANLYKEDHEKRIEKDIKAR